MLDGVAYPHQCYTHKKASHMSPGLVGAAVGMEVTVSEGPSIGEIDRIVAALVGEADGIGDAVPAPMTFLTT